VFTIGVISDTHGYLDPQVIKLFSGVDHILHAGDIGPASLIRQLEKIAPVTAVAGNCDLLKGFRETEVVELGGRTFFLRHIVDVRSPGAGLRALLELEKADAVIFGHSHRPYCERQGGVLLFNPGSAGQQRFNLPLSVGIIRCTVQGLTAVHHDLTKGRGRHA